MLSRAAAPLRHLTHFMSIMVLALATIVTSGLAAGSAHAADPVRAFVLQGSGSGTYDAGVQIPVSATILPGKVFSNWIVGGGTAANPAAASTTITPALGARFVVAIAMQTNIPLPPNSNVLTVYNGKGSGAYVPGTVVTIEANAAPAGYVFSRWLDPSRSIANPLLSSTTLVMPNIRTYAYPLFIPGVAPQPVKVAVTVVGGSPAGTTQQTVGSTMTVKANAAATGKVFDKWTSNVAGLVIANANAAETTMTVPATAVTLTATYKDAVAAKVAVTVAFGTPAGTTQQTVGSALTIKANAPAAGKAFDKWTSSVPGVAIANASAAETTVTVPAVAVTLTATYKNLVLVTVTKGTPATSSLAPGASITISASAPAAGMVFDTWTGDVAALQNKLQATTLLTVPANATAVSVAANYKPATPATVAITVTNGAGGGTFAVGSKITITAGAAPAGQVFDKWTGPAGVVFDNATASPTMLTVPAAAATVVANFKPASNANVVTLTSPTAGGNVSAQGETVFGTVKSPTTAAGLTAKISTNGRTVPLDIDPTTGRFALRLFEGEVTIGAPVSLAFERKDAGGTLENMTVVLNGANRPADLQQVVGRLTFGATPALLNEIKSIGYATWVNRQLNPATINDSAFQAMNPDGLLRLGSTVETYQLAQSVPAWQTAYAAYSQRQLQEVMTNFWTNHFYSIDKGFSNNISRIDEIKAFRAGAFGKFRELLRVSSKSARMMQYLDNIYSNKNGINQNYARELLELHTVGVNGGYAREDVVAIAAVLTGWQAKQTSADKVLPVTYQFNFDPNRHNTGNKVIPFLTGATLPNGSAFSGTITGATGAAGEQEGELVIDILARHPKTQAFVCGKIVELLVSDARPQSYIDICTAEWERTDGSMKDILSKILTAPNYLAIVDYQRTKAKTPYETIVSYLRNFGIYPVQGKEFDFYNDMRTIVKDAGMDVVDFGVPTGFKETSKAWINTASFIKKFSGLTNQITYFTSADSGTNRRGTVNYSQLIKDAGMTTAQAAAAYLLALTAGDRYRQDEYDAVVAALKGTQGFSPTTRDEERALRKAVGLIVNLPSVQLQ